MRKHKQDKYAFTLAEVLITLGVIGVVAAMTMPTLIGKWKEKELATRARKAYSMIEQAIQLAQNNYGTPGDNTGLFDLDKSSEEVTKEFAKYFNGARFCEAGSNAKGCTDVHYNIKYNSKLEDTSGNTASNPVLYAYPRIRLNDGAIIALIQYNTVSIPATCNIYNSDGSLKYDDDGNPATQDCTRYYRAMIIIDTNSSLPPNQFGRDAFAINIFDNKIEPHSWSYLGGKSLSSILTGGNAIYSDYTLGQPFEW